MNPSPLFSSGTFRICFLPLLLALVAGDGWHASGAAPAVSPEAAARLAALEKGFQEAADREADTAHKAAVEALDKGYDSAVERALADAIQAGKTEDALALRGEKQRIEKGDAIPAEDAGNAIAASSSLQALRTTYRASKADLEAARLKKLQPLFDKYMHALDALAVELTKAGKLDDAELVKAVSGDVDKARTTGNTGASVASTSGKARLSGVVRSFTNTLGMKFVPVPGTKVLFCIHETRRKDYSIFAAANPNLNDKWRNPVLDNGTPVGTRSDDEPVVNVGWQDAVDFCAWLSKQEGHVYRLPTDREWSFAVGIGEEESETATPGALNGKIKGKYPWGKAWPPPKGSANLRDQSSSKIDKERRPIKGYNDGFPTLAPVMSFKPNNLGIYDLAGNVWEWCADWGNGAHEGRVVRGGSWYTDSIPSSMRMTPHPGVRIWDYGFRCVVEPDK